MSVKAPWSIGYSTVVPQIIKTDNREHIKGLHHPCHSRVMQTFNSLRPSDAYMQLTIMDLDNGLSPDRCQAIAWTSAGILSIGPLRTHFSEILIETLTFSSKKMRSKVSSAKGWPFCLDLNVLMCSLSQRGRESENVLLSWRHTAVSPTEHWCMF